MWIAVCFLLITAAYEGACGFTSGAPCNVRNTALIETRGYWRIPREPLQCVDITSLGTKSTIPLFPGLILATTLYADHMRLTAVPVFVLNAVRRVELIDLSGNLLTDLDKNVFLSLIHLQVLLLENNQVEVPNAKPLLSSHSLKTLSLSNNKIRQVHTITFLQLGNLRILYLDRNLLTHVSGHSFKALKNLKYLHLGNNRLKEIPRIFNPKAILILKGNPFNKTEVIKR